MKRFQLRGLQGCRQATIVDTHKHKASTFDYYDESMQYFCDLLNEQEEKINRLTELANQTELEKEDYADKWLSAKRKAELVDLFNDDTEITSYKITDKGFKDGTVTVKIFTRHGNINLLKLNKEIEKIMECYKLTYVYYHNRTDINYVEYIYER